MHNPLNIRQRVEFAYDAWMMKQNWFACQTLNPLASSAVVLLLTCVFTVSSNTVILLVATGEDNWKMMPDSLLWFKLPGSLRNTLTFVWMWTVEGFLWMKMSREPGIASGCDITLHKPSLRGTGSGFYSTVFSEQCLTGKLRLKQSHWIRKKNGLSAYWSQKTSKQASECQENNFSESWGQIKKCVLDTWRLF